MSIELKDICVIFTFICILYNYGFLDVYLDEYLIDDEYVTYDGKTYNGTIVHPHYDNVYYVGANDEKVTLVNNDTAEDVSYKKVMSFISKDKTDVIRYNESSFMCGEYAEMVHNNAEQAGIKCAWVSIDFENKEIGHACNAFNTTDRGIIYIDCTEGDMTSNVKEGIYYTPENMYGSSSLSYETMGKIKSYHVFW